MNTMFLMEILANIPPRPKIAPVYMQSGGGYSFDTDQHVRWRRLSLDSTHLHRASYERRIQYLFSYRCYHGSTNHGPISDLSRLYPISWQLF